MKCVEVVGLTVLVAGFWLCPLVAGQENKQDEKWVAKAKKWLAENEYETNGLKNQSPSKRPPTVTDASLKPPSCLCSDHQEKLVCVHLRRTPEGCGSSDFYGLYCPKGQHYWIWLYGHVGFAGVEVSKFYGPFEDKTREEREQEKHLQKLMEQLGTKDEKVRAEAEAELKKLGGAALEALEKELKNLEEIEKVARFTEEGLKNHRALKERVKNLADEIRADMDKQVSELLKRLDDDEWKVRVEATEKLIELGKSARQFVRAQVESELKRAREAKNAEVENRCEEILKEIGRYDGLDFLRAKDYWAQKDVFKEDENLDDAYKEKLRKVAEEDNDPKVRLRARRLLCENSRYTQEQIEYVRLGFRYLEEHLEDKTVHQFAPEKGFNNYCIGGAANGELYFLIEQIVNPNVGGLNLKIDSKKKQVVEVKHWGQDRSH